MKKIVIIGLIFMLTLTGCTVDMFNSTQTNTIEKKYQFGDYNEFLDVKEDLIEDDSYFVIDTEETMKLKSVDAIDVYSVFEDIVVIREKREDVKIRYFGAFSKKSVTASPEYNIETKSTFKFYVEWKNLKGASRAMLVVYVPLDYQGDYLMESISGDIKAEELVSKEITGKTVSGNLTVAKVEADQLSLNTTSGNITVHQGILNSVKCLITSGNAVLEDLDVKDIFVETVSGDIEVQIKEQKNDIVLKSVSGDVSLTSQEGYNATIDFNAVSGQIEADVALKNVEVQKRSRLIGEVGKGNFAIKIDTVSGNIIFE